MMFWAQRTPREKWLLVTLAGTLLLYGMVIGLWQPLLQKRDAAFADIGRYTSAHAEISAIAASGLPVGTAVSDQPIPTILADSAALFQLTIRRLQPTADAAEVSLDDAAFADVLPWLEMLERDHGLHITALTLTRRPEPGQVATTLSITR
jgi:general secretion pathway protein M